MASGTIQLTRNATGVFLLGQILWESTSNGTAANTSTVTATLQLQRLALNTTTGTFKGTFTVGNTSETISWYGSLPSKTWVTVKTITTTVNHNANGAGNCYLYALINGPAATTMEGTYVSGSATVTLDTIPRYASIISVTDFTDEGNPTITYSNPAGEAVETLQAYISLDGRNGYIVHKDIPKNQTSCEFPLTEDERNRLREATPNSKTLTVYVFIKSTIGGSSSYVSKTATMTIVNADPIISPTVVDVNETTTGITGNNRTLIPGHSLAQATFNATAKKYATITSRRLEHGNQILTADGTLSVTYHPFRFIVTDSRGNKTTKDTNDTNYIVPYINPTCSIGNNIPATDGTFSLVVSGLFYNGSIGKTSNSLTVQYRMKTAYGSYGDWTNISSVSKNGNSYTATADFAGLDYQTVYTFQARALDVLNTSGVLSAEKAVISQPVFDWGKNDFKFNVPVYDKTGAQIGNSETEWQNPPMLFGVEYCTTERYMGKAVYAKCVNYGYITAGEHSITHGIESIDEVVGLEMINRTYGIFTSYFNASADRTNVNLNTPWSMGGLVYIIKYTKL